jgi:hypothetical protein
MDARLISVQQSRPSCHYPCQCCVQIDGARGGDAWICHHNLPDWFHVERDGHVPRAPPL